ncbi:MAG TPA: hypothetical protein VL463_34655 [Kofleriaceae bacterium]|nr:hypothetical protein [Kofleriaceae bacterium]
MIRTAPKMMFCLATVLCTRQALAAPRIGTSTLTGYVMPGAVDGPRPVIDPRLGPVADGIPHDGVTDVDTGDDRASALEEARQRAERARAERQERIRAAREAQLRAEGERQARERADRARQDRDTIDARLAAERAEQRRDAEAARAQARADQRRREAEAQQAREAQRRRDEELARRNAEMQRSTAVASQADGGEPSPSQGDDAVFVRPQDWPAPPLEAPTGGPRAWQRANADRGVYLTDLLAPAIDGAIDNCGDCTLSTGNVVIAGIGVVTTPEAALPFLAEQLAGDPEGVRSHIESCIDCAAWIFTPPPMIDPTTHRSIPAVPVPVDHD